MGNFLWILFLILFLYWALLIARLVIEFLQSLARHWRPRGITVVVVEIICTLTDPPIKGLRRVLKPIDLGGVRLDLSMLLVLIVVTIAMRVTSTYANHLAPIV